MATKGQPYVGDRPVLEVTVLDQDGIAVDVSAATVRQILIRRPDGTELAKTATLVTDGTDGKISYEIEEGVLDRPGLWRYVGYVVIGGRAYTGAASDGDPLHFTVREW